AHANLKAAARPQSAEGPFRHFEQQLADRHEQTLLLDADGRVAESRGELERIDAVVVDDAVDVDVPDVAFRLKPGRHLLERRVEHLVRLAPEHRGPHLAGRWADVAAEQLLVLEVDADGVDEFLAVEERAGGDLNAHDAPLELEFPDALGMSGAIVL